MNPQSQICFLLRQCEEKLSPNPNYMQTQKLISEQMWNVLIDWLIDVTIHFDLQNTTFHYGISYIDWALSCMEIEKNKL